MSEIDELIQRLDSWLKKNRPDFYASLNPGATDKEISHFESELGWKLPEDFVRFYQWKNGDGELIPGWRWLSLKDIEELRNWFSEYTQNKPFEQQQPWHPDFIPFLDNGGGDYYCLDRLGIWNGVSNQIIYHCYDDRSYIESSRFDLWLEVIVLCFKSGSWIREQNQEFCDFEQSDGWSATFTKIAGTIIPGYPKEEDW